MMKLTIGRKIWAFSIATFMLVGLATSCVFWQMTDALTWQKMILDVKWPATQMFSDSLASMNMMRAKVREAIIDREDPVSFAHDVEQYQKTAAVLDSCIERLLEMSKGFQKEENKQRVRTMAADLQIVEQSQQRALSLAKKGDAKGAIVELRSVAAGPGADLRKLMVELQNQNSQLTEKIFKDIHSDLRTSLIWLFSCFGVVVIMGSFISWRVAGQASSNADALCRRAQEIATGNLTGTSLVTNSHDEFEDLAGSMNLMQRQLQQFLSKISTTANQLADASEKITTGSSQTAETSKRQTDQTNMVATAIHEMGATVHEVSEHSRSASAAAERASSTASDGGTLVQETVVVMNRIAESNSRVAARVTKLGESSQRVGKIASVIDDIADQTNLLALNAAIEAARAGDQGRGFAVVADEVRKLAERTAAATKEIAQILEVIEAESRDTASAITDGRRDVEAGLDGSHRAGEALQQIIKMASDVGEMVSQIATAATQQSNATQDIQASAERIAAMAAESTNVAEDSAQACSQLSTLTFNLREIVGHFKVQAGSDYADGNDLIGGARHSRDHRSTPFQVGLTDRPSTTISSSV